MKKKITGFASDFKAFATRGNVIDLAVGVIIGGAFGKITTSLVNDLLMPLIGLIIGGFDFKSWVFVLPNPWGAPEPPLLKIGSFIQASVDFIIIAFCVFLIVKLAAKMRKKAEEAPPPAPPEPTEEILLLREIRDSLKK